MQDIAAVWNDFGFIGLAAVSEHGVQAVHLYSRDTVPTCWRLHFLLCRGQIGFSSLRSGAAWILGYFMCGISALTIAGGAIRFFWGPTFVSGRGVHFEAGVRQTLHLGVEIEEGNTHA